MNSHLLPIIAVVRLLRLFVPLKQESIILVDL
jgi:hypothetical protein